MVHLLGERCNIRSSDKDFSDRMASRRSSMSRERILLSQNFVLENRYVPESLGARHSTIEGGKYNSTTNENAKQVYPRLAGK